MRMLIAFLQLRHSACSARCALITSYLNACDSKNLRLPCRRASNLAKNLRLSPRSVRCSALMDPPMSPMCSESNR